MEHLLRLQTLDLPVRQWRKAALILTGVAAIELVLLVAIGGALVLRSGGDVGTTAAPVMTAKTAPAKATKATSTPTTAATSLPRTKIGVLVLNGNGRQGAAGVAASRVSHRGYRVRGVANAPSADYLRSIVMYRPGFASEGRRLARDLGISIVGPLDGMRPAQLQGAHAVLILGA